MRASRPRDRTVGIVKLENGTEVMLLESDVPPDVIVGGNPAKVLKPRTLAD